MVASHAHARLRAPISYVPFPLPLFFLRLPVSLNCGALSHRALGAPPRACLPFWWCCSSSRPSPGSWLCVACLRYFRNPCDRLTPPTRNFKNFKFLKNSQKILKTFTFGERAFTFGERAFTFGERTFTFGDNRGFRGFWNFFFLLLRRGFGTLWVGGPRRGFRKHLTLASWKNPWKFDWRKFKGQHERGNRTESLWEGNLPLWEGLWEDLWRPLKKLWKPLKNSENLPLRDPLRGRFPSQRLSVLLPLSCCPLNSPRFEPEPGCRFCCSWLSTFAARRFTLGVDKGSWA